MNELIYPTLLPFTSVYGIMIPMKTVERDFIIVHLTFALAASITVIPRSFMGIPMGLRLTGLVLLYNLLIPLTALWRKHPEWFSIWVFVLPISILQIFPDWFLASQLQVLSFPKTGAIMIGPVPIFMAGLWAIPLVIIIFTTQQIGIRNGLTGAIVAAGGLSAVLFLGSEATLWSLPVWQAQSVHTVQHIALYLVIPEILLGIEAYLAYQYTRSLNVGARLFFGANVMILYFGGVCLFYLVFEQIIFR
jgi:hypothetical protein